MMATINGVSMTTKEVKGIVSDLKAISEDTTVIMGDFRNCMNELTGTSEGGIIDQTADAAVQVYNAFESLCCCFLDLGIHIGEFLKMVLTKDGDAAASMKESIQKKAHHR